MSEGDSRVRRDRGLVSGILLPGDLNERWSGSRESVGGKTKDAGDRSIAALFMKRL